MPVDNRKSVPLGRGDELAVIDRVISMAMAGQPGVLVIAGEAGLGKTTLANAALARAERLGIRVGVGHCLDVSTHVPCGPVAEAFHDTGDASLRTAPPTPQNASMALAEAAASEPLVLALEDIQWAERSTLDFLRTVSHTAKGGVLVLATVRSDEVRHNRALHELLADLARSDRFTRLDLQPLDDQALRELAHRRLSETEQERGDAHGRVDDCVRLSAGNPLFLEALIDHTPTQSSIVPSRLADLFVLRVDDLPHQAGAVLRAASVAGTRLDTELLTCVTSKPEDDVVAALQEARTHDLLVVRRERLEFRHELVRAALYEDLLPSQRRGMHRRLVRLLRRRSTESPTDMSLAARTADHAIAAGDLATALQFSLRAGLLWRRGGVDGLEHLRRALELWPSVPEAPRVARTSHAEVLRELGDLLFTLGEYPEALAVLRTGLAEAAEADDRATQSRIYSTYAGRGPVAGDLDWERALEQSIELAGPAPSLELAMAELTNGAADALVRGRPRDAQRWLSRAAATAHTARADRVEGVARAQLASVELTLGQVTSGLAHARRAAVALERVGDINASLLVRGDLAWALASYTPAADALIEAEATAARARASGLLTAYFHALEQAATIRIWRGELAEAERVVEDMAAVGVFSDYYQLVKADLDLARGGLEQAADAHSRGLAWMQTLDTLDDEYVTSVRLEIQLALGDLSGATSTLAAFAETVGETDSVDHLTVVACYGHLLLRASSRRHEPVPHEIVEASEQSLRRLQARDTSPWRVSRIGSRVSVALACRSARGGEPSPELWQQAINDLEQCGFTLLRVRLQPHLVEDLVAAGRRDDARLLAQATSEEARSIGAECVVTHMDAVARRARLAVPRQRLDPVLARLTAREREVLDLVERGATNRDIATTLVISEKTAGVHVSHILAKLGVNNRGQAVAVARRAASRS